MCVHCEHVLSPGDLIPVVSWVLLRGRCRYCHNKISWQYPVVEIISSIIFALSAFFWPYKDNGLVSLLALGIFFVALTYYIILCIYDIKWMLLPDKLTYSAAIFSFMISVIISVFIQDISFYGWLGDVFFSLLISSGLFWILFLISSGTWIGGGDVKLGISIGLLLSSFEKSFMMLFVASLLGTLFSVPLLIKKGERARKTTIPFGPFLMLSCWMIFIFGTTIINWYKTKILP